MLIWISNYKELLEGIRYIHYKIKDNRIEKLAQGYYTTLQQLNDLQQYISHNKIELCQSFPITIPNILQHIKQILSYKYNIEPISKTKAKQAFHPKELITIFIDKHEINKVIHKTYYLNKILDLEKVTYYELQCIKKDTEQFNKYFDTWLKQQIYKAIEETLKHPLLYEQQYY